MPCQPHFPLVHSMQYNFTGINVHLKMHHGYPAGRKSCAAGPFKTATRNYLPVTNKGNANMQGFFVTTYDECTQR